MPDHIAAELEFLYLLIFRENEAYQLGNLAAREEKAALRRRFLDQHLGRWASPFTAAMREGAQTAYYRELAELTASFITMERAEQ